MATFAARCSYARSAIVSRTTWIQIDRRAGRVALAGERLQVADDPGGALGGVVDRIEIAARVVVELACGQPFGACEDGRERVVQLVRDA